MLIHAVKETRAYGNHSPSRSDFYSAALAYYMFFNFSLSGKVEL